MKRIFTLLTGQRIKLSGILLSFFTFSSLLQAQYTLTDDDVVVEGGYIVKCQTSSSDWGSGDIIIPETLDGQVVTGIGENNINRVFSSKGITGVKLPGTLRIIKDRAFEENEIDSIIIPKSVFFLGEDLFSTVYTLKYVAFEPDSRIRIISENAFRVGSISGEEPPVYFPSNSNENFIVYKDANGNTYAPGDKISNKDIWYYAELPSHELTIDDVELVDGTVTACHIWYPNMVIPESLNNVPVVGIAARVFVAYGLINIKLPDGLTSIGEHAFYNNRLSKIELPSGLKEIKEGAFGCNTLESLEIHSGVTSIGINAFYDNNLKEVNIASTVSYIGESAFNGNRIEKINGAESHGLVFARNTDGSVDSSMVVSFGGSCDTVDFIPRSVTHIGKKAFWLPFEKKGIKQVDLPGNIINIGEVAFYGNDLEYINIPGSVKRIERYAFGDNYNLKNVLFEPNSNLEFLGEQCFAYCGQLDSLNLPDPVLEPGIESFLGWFKDGELATMPIRDPQNDKNDYFARFSLSEYDIIYENVGSLNHRNNPVTYNVGDDIWLNKPYDSTGYRFIGWFGDPEGLHELGTPAIDRGSTGDVTIYAKWEKRSSSVFHASGENNVHAYPNPVSDNLTINLASGQDIETVEISNISGQVVYKAEVRDKNTYTINIGKVESGLLFIRVLDRNGRVFTGKIIKE